MPLRSKKRFKFLFVGGTIHRKGIDVLLEAYLQAFTMSDNVCLVIKDMGGGSFYQGQTAAGTIAELQRTAFAPAIEYLTDSLPPQQMAGLYTACDCLVHPYRGEGFGLPIAEAMASGLAVIVTGYGAALDYCNDETAYLIPARVVEFEQNRIGTQETVGRPWLAEPDREELVQLLQYVYHHAEQARAKGAAASVRIRRDWTWDHSAAIANQRLREIVRRPIRRK